MFVQLLRVKVGDEEADVVALKQRQLSCRKTNLNCFSTQHHEALSALHHEASKLVGENPFNVVRLFDLDAHTNRIDTRLNENPFVFVSADDDGLQQGFLC
jgi:hypothetical protein